MRKYGFTLIEIMVVIVILGVLAAVGVPKLFGMLAKARASEIPVAAGTYIHLQDAFLANKPGPGSWKDIGYGAPGNGRTEYFKYGMGCIDSAMFMTDLVPNTIGWVVSNVKNLNECSSGGVWVLTLSPSGEHDLKYQYLASSGECASMTSQWTASNVNATGCDAAPAADESSEQKPKSTTSQEPESHETSGPESSTASEPETPKGTDSDTESSTTSNSSNGSCPEGQYMNKGGNCAHGNGTGLADQEQNHPGATCLERNGNNGKCTKWSDD